MYNIKSLDTNHKDVIHDIAFDYYGRRMATCSSDQAVKIWNLNDEGLWELNATLKSHSGAVWKVTWAHPEFGQIIATCSFDRSASIYEETVSETGHGMQTTWLKRCSLDDARSSVTDIKFAPKSMGLMLATCSTDGLVRIYEAFDVMDLAHWTPTHDIHTRLQSCSCLSWNPSPSRLCSPLLAVGSDDGCMGGSGNTNSSVSGGRVAVFAYSEVGTRWEQVETVSSVTDPVHDIAFAPNPGRSFHTLAIAAKDLRIIILKPKPANSDDSCGGFELQQAGQFSELGSDVWRVSWNLTGTVLTASGDNGLVKIYKANYMDVWKCVGTLSSSLALACGGDSNQDDLSNSTAVTSSGAGGSRPLTFAAAVAGRNSTNGGAASGAGQNALSASATGHKFLQMPPITHASQVPWH